MQRCLNIICNANNINIGNVLSTFEYNFNNERKETRKKKWKKNAYSMPMIVRLANAMRLERRFFLIFRFAFNVEFFFLVSVTASSLLPMRVCSRLWPMHRPVKMNLILFQGECCNTNNVLFSFTNWIRFLYAQLRRWCANECACVFVCLYTHLKEIKMLLQSAHVKMILFGQAESSNVFGKHLWNCNNSNYE